MPPKKSAIQFVKYALTGIANTAIDFGVYFGLTRLTGFFGTHIFIAKTLSFFAAATFSFFANRRWTFGRTKRASAQEALKFYSTVGSGVFINVGIHYVVVSILHWPDYIGIVAAAGFTVVWGFFFSKFFVFNDN